MNTRRTCVLAGRVMAGIATSMLLAAQAVHAANVPLKTLHGHLPKLPAGIASKGRLPGTNQLHLAIGVELGDTEALDSFLTQLYDPSSPGFHQFLSPEQFTAKFGPSAESYQAIENFAATNHLKVSARHGNRLLLDVEGAAADIERAFHLNLLTYPHPKEPRDFFAPDTEPSVDSRLAIADISGLDNYSLPRPKSLRIEPGTTADTVTPKGGSSPKGSYMGNDFRAAYAPGVTLTGAGQMLGLLEFDGFYASDMTAYETTAGLPAVPIQTILLDGYNGAPSSGANSGNSEVSMDIEVAMAMAPGLSKILVFEAGPSGAPNDVLNAMAASNQVKQLSCSWGWSGGPKTTTDNIFKQMAAQGQSFFNASGDSDAFTTGANSSNGVDNPQLSGTPSSSPYITMVGGTTLTTTGPGGAWASEKVWNWGAVNGSYSGSSGGISSYYAIPSWQAGTSMAANGGSSTYRNIPDVAMTADNVYYTYGNGSSGSIGGTSCAAPLWAAFTALINQQASAAGRQPVGLLNPALYNLGNGSTYGAAFHDITTGNNVSSASPNAFYAVAGYDLCTGWGTPAGQNLIDALAGAASPFSVSPLAGLSFGGPVGGPFAPTSGTISITNSSASPIAWSLMNTSSWLRVSAASGTLPAGSGTEISVSLANSAGSLSPATYTTSLAITSPAGGVFGVPINLQIGQSILQNGGFEAGSFNGWNLSGNTVISGSIYNAVEPRTAGFTVVHSGSYGAFLGDTSLATLSQTVSTVAGQYYLLSFWLDNPSAGTGQQFVASWNGGSGSASQLYSISNPASFSWANAQFLVQAKSSSATIRFQAANPPGYFGVDDVSLIPIPTPAFQTAGTTGTGFQLSWATMPGLVYQVQYKTSLTQQNWTNLGAPATAGSTSTTFTDTAALTSSPQRFYRLVIAP